jgi:hypothetical protein
LTRVHVVGCPRSGTTLMMEMLATCYEHDGHCEHEQTFFTPVPMHSGVYFSKQPNDVNWIEPFVRRDFSAFFIAMIRDPRAVVCSRHSGHEGVYFTNYRVWKKAERSLVRLMRYSRVVVVRFEDLTADPDHVQRSIEEAMPFLVRKYRFSEYHQHASVSQGAARALGGVRPVSHEVNAAWKKHRPRLKQQLDRHPGLVHDLITWGYEDDQSWVQQLADVKPIRYPCRYPDRPTPLRDLETGLRVRRKRKRYLETIG